MENFGEKNFVMRGVRFTKTDDTLICAGAKAQRLKYSEFVRQACLKYAKQAIRQRRAEGEIAVND